MNYLRKNTMNALLILLWLGLGLSLTTARIADDYRVTIGNNDMNAPLLLVLPSRDGIQ